MPITGVELSQVCGHEPLGGGVINDRYIVCYVGRYPSSAPLGAAVTTVHTYTIFDALLGTANLYSGLGGWNRQSSGSCVYNNRLWVGGNGNGIVGSPNLLAIQSNGSITSHGTLDSWGPMAGANGHIFWDIEGNGVRYRDISDPANPSILLSGADSNGVFAPTDDILVTAGGTSPNRHIQVWDVSSMPPTLVKDINTGSLLHNGSATMIGSRIYWSSLGYYDWVTDDYGGVAVTPPGIGNLYGHIAAGPDGYLYLTSTTYPGELAVIDPNTGAWTREMLLPSRLQRGPVFAANGKIYVPSGEPLSR